MTTVVALSGNALIRPGDRGTAAEQSARLREPARSLEPLLDADPRITALDLVEDALAGRAGTRVTA